MKADRGLIERALDTAAPQYRLFLLYGPDESGSRDLARRIEKSLGADAERIDLSGPTLKGDPARLTDEAAAIALFGGRRHIRVEPAGDEIDEAVEALLTAAAAGNPVVVVAGALRKDSRLLKRALADPAALAFASYAPEGAQADRVANDIGRAHGLRMRPDVAQRLAAATGADRALLPREIEKFTLFLDATPEDPLDLEHDALDALGADAEEGDLTRLVDLLLDGRGGEAEGELARLAGEGITGIPVLRAVQRRLLLLAELRAASDGGSIEPALARAGKAIFWKEQDALRRQAPRWDSAGLATAINRLAVAGRDAMMASGPGGLAIEAELLAIGRAAARRR
jgi:DNA polymerase III subunit delta